MSNKMEEKAMKSADKRALKPKLRFPEFQDAGEWNKKQLEDALSPIVRERKKPINPYTGLGLRSHGKGTFLKNLEIPEKNSMEYLYEVQSDDLVVNITFAWEGAIAIAQQTDAGALVSHRFPTYTFKRNVAIPEFFQYIILDKQFIYKLGVISPGGAGRNRVLNKNDFLKLRTLLPDIDEQQKIADCLTSLDELITAEVKKLDMLKAHKKGLMQQLFPAEGETLPKLRFPEFREQWIETQLDKLCSNISSGRDQIDPNGAFDLYGSTSVIGKTRNPSYSGERILVARVGANAGLLTKAKGIFGVTDNTLVVGLNPSTNIDFLFHYLGNININRLIFGSGQPLITGSILKTLPILVPADTEQRKISACLSSLDEMIITQGCKLETIKTHKKGLMQQLFPSSEEVEA